MRAGQLRHLITLQQRGGAVDDLNQPVPDDWVDVAVNVPADIRYLSGLETVKADAPVDVTRASIRIRYRAGVEPNTRALHGAVIYDIKSVLPDPTGQRWLDMVCDTGINQG